MRVDQQGRQHVLELKLLEKRNHEDSSVVSTYDLRWGVFVLVDGARSDFFICEEKAELARVVERLEDLLVESDQGVWDLWLTLFRLGAEKAEVADVEGELDLVWLLG